MVTAVSKRFVAYLKKQYKSAFNMQKGKIARWNWTVRERYDSERREARP